MQDAVIVSAVRTPTGKFLGGLKGFAATELGALVDAVRGTLAGDLTALRRNYTVTMQGDLAGWRLTLTPANQRVARFLRDVDIEGAGTEPRSVRIVQANGDQSLMTIQPRS